MTPKMASREGGERMGSLVSPTSISNSIPRPRSPRRPDYRSPGKSPQQPPGGLLSAESFQRTYTSKIPSITPSKIPSIRRRSHQEMGQFGSSPGNQQQQQTPQQQRQAQHTRARQQTSPGMCGAADPIGFLNNLPTPNNGPNGNGNRGNARTSVAVPAVTGCVQASYSQSRDYAVKYGPPAKQHLGACMQQTSYTAGKASHEMVELATNAAEVYRQECKTDNRGDDAVFFQETKGPQHEKEGIALARGHSSDTSESSEQRDSRSASPVRRQRKTNIGSAHSKRSHGSGNKKSQRKGRSNRDQKFPDAIHIMSSNRMDDISPPRVDRINPRNVGKFEPTPEQNHGELREARMQLFQMGPQADMSDPETRLKFALQDLERQDGVIDGLKKQLRMNQKSLDEMVTNLEQAKSIAQNKQYKATETRARSVQERKRLEDMYERELEQNKKLDSMVSTLQVEISSLKVSLRNAKSGGRGDASKGAASNNNQNESQLISMKAEIVDLRSQLAEAKASNLDDQSSMHTPTTAEVDTLMKKLAAAEHDVRALREKEGQLQQLEKKLGVLQDKHAESEKKLEDELKNQKSAAEQTQSNLESMLKESQAAAQDAASELAKVKASLQKLEKDRSRVRLHSAADVDRVNRQLTKSRDETNKLKKQLQEEQTSSRASMTKVKAEMHDLRKKLVQANNNVSRSTPSFKEREQSQKMSREIKNLQTQLKSKEEKIESLTTTVARMAEKANLVEGLMAQLEDTTVAPSQDVSLLEQEIDLLKSNEASLRADLQLKTKQLDEALAKVAKYAEDNDVETLRRQLELFKDTSAESRPASPLLSDLQEEIGTLREKLSEAEAINQAFSEEKSLASNSMKDVSVLQEENATLKSKLEEIEASNNHAAEVLKMENDILKSQLAKAEGKLQAAAGAEKPDVRLKAMEQAFLNQVSVLKSRLHESETRCKEESSRADEERRISREKDAERSQAIEKLRREKEELDAENCDLEDTVIELRTKLASTVCNLELNTSTDSSESTQAESPKNLTRVRNELALARARLSAARDFSRNIGSNAESQDSEDQHSRSMAVITEDIPLLETEIDEISRAIPDSPDGSVKSQESSWAPPSFTSTPPQSIKMNTSISSSMSRPPSPPSMPEPSLTLSSTPSMEFIGNHAKDSLVFSHTQNTEEQETGTQETELSTQPSRNDPDSEKAGEKDQAAATHESSKESSPTRFNFYVPQASPIVFNSGDNQTFFNVATGSMRKVRSTEPEKLCPPTPRSSVSLDLQEQIEASNRRLEVANARLQTLSARPDFPQKSPASHSRGSYFGQEPTVTKEDCRDSSPGASSGEVPVLNTPRGRAFSDDPAKTSSSPCYREPLQPIVGLEDGHNSLDGFVDEVVPTLSGNIEIGVNNLRFADI